MNEAQAERLIAALERIADRLDRLCECVTDLAEPLVSLGDCASTDGDETVFQIWKAGESD